MIRGIKFVGVPVTNQDAALKFWTETVGMEVVTDQPFNDKQRWIELSIPGAETGIAPFTPEGHQDRIGQFTSISFWSDDIFATAAAMKRKGVVFAQDPRKEQWGISAIFKDPDGNMFVLASR